MNLSDLAACGARPLAFTLSLALPAADESFLAPFARGLLALADRHDCELVGGDTTRGPLTIASAGHQMPYVDGREMPGDTGLPLGIVPDSPYPETSSRLGEGVQLTLITDGVLEARDKSGELFGFERTTAISTQSAEQIAACAQHFGQEDDITVVTVTREAPGEAGAVRDSEAHAPTWPA